MHFFQLNFNQFWLFFAQFQCFFTQIAFFLVKIGQIWFKLVDFWLFLMYSTSSKIIKNHSKTVFFHQFWSNFTQIECFFIKFCSKWVFFAHFWCFFVIFLMYSYTSKIIKNNTFWTNFCRFSTNFARFYTKIAQKVLFLAIYFQISLTNVRYFAWFSQNERSIRKMQFCIFLIVVHKFDFKAFFFVFVKNEKLLFFLISSNC